MNVWLLVFSIYAAPPTAVDWDGPWTLGMCFAVWVLQSATITHGSIELTLKTCFQTDIASTEILLKNHGQPENDRLTRWYVNAGVKMQRVAGAKKTMTPTSSGDKTVTGPIALPIFQAWVGNFQFTFAKLERRERRLL